jgi:hypothetical protein
MRTHFYLILFLVFGIAVDGHSQLTFEDFEEFLEDASKGLSKDFKTYPRQLLAKAQPDECFYGVGDPSNSYQGLTFDCPSCVGNGGEAKVNQAYVWGMDLNTANNKIFYGTGPNVNCLVSGVYFGNYDSQEGPSSVCEQSANIFPGAPLGDWRPAQFLVYDIENATNQDLFPIVNGANGAEVNNTVGLRAVGSTDDIVIYAGPTFLGTIQLFFVNPSNNNYIGTTELRTYDNIRKFIYHDGELYATVRRNENHSMGQGGAILKWTGGMSFVEVGLLDTEAAEIEFHEGRFYVTTWPIIDLQSFPPPALAGLYRSEPILVGGLTMANSGGWDKIWEVDDYEPDPVIAASYGGGALASYEGKLYWGTMHVPFASTLIHGLANNPPINSDEDAILNFLAPTRSITIFRGDNLESSVDIELLYGSPVLPRYDKPNDEWYLTSNNMGGTLPLYGLPGFGNLFNNYTWSMEVFDDQLFVGTMDHSGLLFGFEGLDELVDLPPNLPFDCDAFTMNMDLCDDLEDIYDLWRNIADPTSFVGADLWRFPSGDEPAVPESFAGLGNYLSYGVRNMVSTDSSLYVGMANPVNLAAECGEVARSGPIAGGWELIELYIPEFIPTMSQWGIIVLSLIFLIFGLVALKQRRLSFPKNH